jgi:hypothetical protein
MRRAFALFFIFFFAFQPAFAGVNSHMTQYSGGTLKMPPVEATGFFDTEPKDHFEFSWVSGKNRELGKYPEGIISVPYENVTKLICGETKHLRVGQTIALTALAGVGGLLLLLSKSKTHFVTIEYKDAEGQAQVVNFEVGKDAVRSLLSSLELRTGKKFEYETATPAKQ